MVMLVHTMGEVACVDAATRYLCACACRLHVCLARGRSEPWTAARSILRRKKALHSARPIVPTACLILAGAVSTQRRRCGAHAPLPLGRFCSMIGPTVRGAAC